MKYLRQISRYITALEMKKLLYGTAGLSIAASFIHGMVTQEHFEEWWGYGMFFIVAALAQLFYGLLLIFQPWQPDPIRHTEGFSAESIYWMGIIGNGFLILLYMVTRTVGIPFFGPEAGEVEPVTLLSLIAKGVEIVMIIALVVLLQRSKAETISQP
jgi:hypothetical protein